MLAKLYCDVFCLVLCAFCFLFSLPMCFALRVGRSGDRIPVGVRFSTHVQTGSAAHPASYTMGTGISSPGIKLQGHGVDHPSSSSAEVKERLELYLYSPSGI